MPSRELFFTFLFSLVGVVTCEGLRSEPPNVQRIKRIFNEADFNHIFPRANGISKDGETKPYSYYGFIRAAEMFPNFCNEAFGELDLDTACRKELAMAFAHFTQETGENTGWGEIPRWRQGLYFISETGCAEGCQAYCTQSDVHPCTPGKSYHGRGALQLSHNYNYGPFSEAIYGDKNKLLDDPDSVLTAENGSLAFGSALWFLMTPQPPKPAIHDIVVGKWQPTDGDKAAGRYPGFGLTTLIINGGMECQNPSDVRAMNRIDYYTSFSDYFNVSPDGYQSCGGMGRF